jgi:hypothetical protein
MEDVADLADIDTCDLGDIDFHPHCPPASACAASASSASFALPLPPLPCVSKAIAQMQSKDMSEKKAKPDWTAALDSFKVDGHISEEVYLKLQSLLPDASVSLPQISPSDRAQKRWNKFKLDRHKSPPSILSSKLVDKSTENPTKSTEPTSSTVQDECLSVTPRAYCRIQVNDDDAVNLELYRTDDVTEEPWEAISLDRCRVVADPCPAIRDVVLDVSRSAFQSTYPFEIRTDNCEGTEDVVCRFAAETELERIEWMQAVERVLKVFDQLSQDKLLSAAHPTPISENKQGEFKVDLKETLVKGPPGIGLGLHIRHDGGRRAIVVEKIHLEVKYKIQVGDIITAMAGVDVRNMDFGKVMDLVKSIGVGQSCLVEYSRYSRLLSMPDFTT